MSKKCDICERDIEIKNKMKGWPNHWSINASVIGEVIDIKGCQTCCENINNKIVIPSRVAVMDKEVIKNE